ncbi:HNH endonuclease [Actinomyces succiniciruminis]|nr:HNH endonuclease [Actinomyces succiniciruminis]
MLVDDQLFQNRKFRALMRRGRQGDADAWGAGLLWMMAGSQVKAGYATGMLTTFDVLALVEDPEVAPRLARVLVEEGLWHDVEHPCPYGRCPDAAPGQYVFHDWRHYHKKTGDEEREARALQAERNDPRLKQEVWQRDRLPGQPQGAPLEALCAYCGKPVRRTTVKGDMAAEVDHVIPKPLGVDNLVISHRRCNRVKGQRTPAAAGLTLHLTDAHRAALERRRASSHPGGYAGLLDAMLGRDQWPLDTDGVLFTDTDSHPAREEGERRSHPSGSAEPLAAPPAVGWEGRGSHPSGSAEPPTTGAVGDSPTAPAGVPEPMAPLEPPGRQDPAPAFPGRSLPNSGSARPQDAPVQGSSATQGTAAPVPAQPAPGVDRISRIGVLEALEACFGAPLPADLAVAAMAAHTGKSLTPDQQTMLDAALAYAYARTGAHGRARALTGARALAWHGTAWDGLARQGMAWDGTAPDGGTGRSRRRRRRAKKKPTTCPTHGDRIPCRLCQEEELQ